MSLQGARTSQRTSLAGRKAPPQVYNNNLHVNVPRVRACKPCTRVARARASTQEVEDTFKDELGDLALKIGDLAKSVDEALQGTSIFLVGMMGSGKSTTGRMLANVLRYCFFDSDSVIEQAVGGASVSDIFAENGEDGFRDLESAVLSELSSYKNCVIATGGGVVVRPQNWGSMQVGITVYLEGSAEVLARRVLSQDGASSRPLLAETGGDEAATIAKLDAILKTRQDSYRNADCIVSVAGQSATGASAAECTVQMVYRILHSVDEKIKASAAERAERQKFTIVREGGKPEA